MRGVAPLFCMVSPQRAGGYPNFAAVPEVAGPHVGALEGAGNALGLCLYREFVLGQGIAVAACSLRRGLVRVTRSLPVPPGILCLHSFAQ